MKLFVRDKNKDKDNEVKPIIRYYAEYIGVLGSNKSLLVDEDSYVSIFEDRLYIELLKSKVKIIIPYVSMTDIQHVDAERKWM